MTSYFDIIMIPLQVMIVFFTIYYFVLSLFGILPGKKEKKITTPKTTFAVIAAAPKIYHLGSLNCVIIML